LTRELRYEWTVTVLSTEQ